MKSGLTKLAVAILAVIIITGALGYLGYHSFGANNAENSPQEQQLIIVELNQNTSQQDLKQLKQIATIYPSPINSQQLLVRVNEKQQRQIEELPFVRQTTAYVVDIQSINVDKNNHSQAQTKNKKTSPSGKGQQFTITLYAEKDKNHVVKLIHDAGGSVLKGADEPGSYLRVKLPVDALEAVVTSGLVVSIEPYQSPSFLNDRSSAIIGATPLGVSGFISAAGLTGAGQVVGLADSGLDTGNIDQLHPDLQNKMGQFPKIVMLKAWTNRSLPDDPIGHGTHMAGIIAGTGAASQQKYKGLAPGASLYIQSVLDQGNQIDTPADLFNLYNPAYAANVRIYVNGWGGQVNSYTATTRQIDDFVRKHQDFLAIFGAGNNGPQSATLTPEANSKNTLVVGASESVRPVLGPDSDGAGTLASLSSRGPTADGRIKPDLIVPGTAIVSTASRLIGGDYAPNTQYTVLKGTSMSAATAGGAAALLREYWQKEQNIKNPSAALMKAALINGASFSGAPGTGFGQLDIATTVLSLHEKYFHFVDEQQINHQSTSIFEYELEETERPFKATLAWTDLAAPVSIERALVHDLDLIVTDPDGKKYWGNDFAMEGIKDDRNNVEQVLIPKPVKGTYTIEVKGADISPALGTSVRQQFALVYGQPMARQVIQQVDQKNKQLITTKQETVNLNRPCKNMLDGKLVPCGDGNIWPGQDIFIGFKDRPVYLSGQIWQGQTVKSLPLAGGNLLMEANPLKNEGGYYISPAFGLGLIHDSIEKEQLMQSLLRHDGAGVTALVNPMEQTAWPIDVEYQQHQGVIYAHKNSDRTIHLVGEKEPYYITEDATVLFQDQVVAGSPVDLPFGSLFTADADQLMAGMKVNIVLVPKTRDIKYMQIEREQAVGKVTETNTTTNTISLEGGPTYKTTVGAPVILDGRQAALKDILPGQHVSLLLANGQVILIQAFTNTVYGQVVFVNKKEHTVYLRDQNNDLKIYQLATPVLLKRWQQQVDLSALLPGDWVRLILDQQEQVQVVYIAEQIAQEGQTVQSYEPETGRMIFSEEQQAQVVSLTLITKNSLPVQLADIKPGEKVSYTILNIPGHDYGILAALDAKAKTGVKVPRLMVSCYPLEQQLLVMGKTSGDKIYIYPQGQRLPYIAWPDDYGEFTFKLPKPSGDSLQVVVVETSKGGVYGEYVTIPRAGIYKDVSANHWAYDIILEMTEKGYLRGYPGGEFKPEQNISRLEFLALLARTMAWNPKAAPEDSRFQDIPAWGAGIVEMALEKNVLAGYLDGKFKPEQPITRIEAAAMLARTLALYDIDVAGETQNIKFSDADQIPPWAIEQVQAVAGAGILKEVNQAGSFEPNRHLTRAETAVALWRLKNTLEQ